MLALDIISILRAFTPEAMAKDIVSVQPISGNPLGDLIKVLDHFEWRSAMVDGICGTACIKFVKR